MHLFSVYSIMKWHFPRDNQWIYCSIAVLWDDHFILVWTTEWKITWKHFCVCTESPSLISPYQFFQQIFLPVLFPDWYLSLPESPPCWAVCWMVRSPQAPPSMTPSSSSWSRNCPPLVSGDRSSLHPPHLWSKQESYNSKSKTSSPNCKYIQIHIFIAPPDIGFKKWLKGIFDKSLC